MVKFRFVILDDFDNVVKVLHETKEYKDDHDKEWIDHHYYWLLKYADEYKLADYDDPDSPLIEVQKFEDGEWKYYSNCTEDYFNL